MGAEAPQVNEIILAKTLEVCGILLSAISNYPARACAARGYVIGRGVCLDFFLNQSFISQNTHFQRSILTQIGFSSNLMASGTA